MSKKSVWFLKFSITNVNKNTSLITIGNELNTIFVYKLDIAIN